MSLELALKGQLVRLVDATVVKEPGQTGDQWRIHYSLRLPSLEYDHFGLTPVKGKNTGERLGRFPVQVGELVLADAGYSNPPGIAVVGQGADVRKAGETAEWHVGVKSGNQQIAGRLCAVGKSEAATWRAQRKLLDNKLAKAESSIVQLGHVPKHDDQSSRAWLYG